MERTTRFIVVSLTLFTLTVPQLAAAFDEGDSATPYYIGDPTKICPAVSRPVYLHQHKGKYVELLLSDNWENALTTDERRTILDRFDIVYQYYKEILQAEPALVLGRATIGLVRVAVIPPECIDGKAWTTNAHKEMEIGDSDYNLQMYKSELARGLETNREISIHELGHAFDLWGGYLEYDPTCNKGTNWCHAWTDIWDAFIPYYGRVSGIHEFVAPGDFTADAHLRWWTDHSFGPYYNNLKYPGIYWTSAVENEGFNYAPFNITARDTWAGTMDRYVQLFGVEALIKSMAFIRDYAASNPPSAVATQEQKESLRILAMAAGANANLSCFLDRWRWYTADGKSVDTMNISSLMAYTYGSNNSFCLDADADGYTPLEGDCNDANAAVHPNATEVANGIDDDCDGNVDNAAPPALPLAPWATLAPAAKQDSSFMLSANTNTLNSPIVNGTPTKVRFWVTGVGVVGTVPYASNASFLWVPPTGLPNGTYGYRAQLMNDIRPLSDFTPAQWFAVGDPCTANRYEAETMNHTTGNAYDQGWNVYDSNGYISFNHIFTAGIQQMTVRASGQSAYGTWPTMRVTVGGVQVFNGAVATSTWTDYTISFSAPSGNAEVRIYFTNDFYQAGPPIIDRNLFVDKVTLAVPQCNPPPMAINLGAVNNETDYAMSGAQPLVINQLKFNGWTPSKIIVGIGHTDASNLNGVSVSVNGGALIALSGDWQQITIPFAGQSTINLTVYSTTPRAIRTQWWAQQ